MSITLRYSITKLSDGWSIYDNLDQEYLDRGLEYDEAQWLAESLEHDEPWPSDEMDPDDYLETGIDPDRYYDERREGIR